MRWLPRVSLYLHGKRTTAVLIGLAVVLAMFTSCEFGNKQKITLEGYDLISGYYTTAFQSLSLTVKFQNQPPYQQDLGPTWLKPSWDFIMASPVLLYFDEPTANRGTLRSSQDTSAGFSLSINPDLKTFSLSGSRDLYYRDCTWTYSVNGQGAFRDVNGSPIVSDLQTRGSLNVILTERHQWRGNDADCTEWLSNFRDCLLQLSPSCMESDVDFAREILATPFDAGMVTGASIPQIREIESVATF